LDQGLGLQQSHRFPHRRIAFYQSIKVQIEDRYERNVWSELFKSRVRKERTQKFALKLKESDFLDPVKIIKLDKK